MYSAHSWMGVLTVALFGIQCLFSIVLFAVMKWPEGSEKKKEDWKGVHQFMGHCLFALALATCATGFQGMQSSDLAASYASTMPMDDAMIANATMAAYQGDDVAPDGYSFKSVKSQLASAASIMLIVLGISTFAVIRFLPLVPINQPEVFVPCDKDYK